MKKEFSTHWKGSRQPRKQRKYVAMAPSHIKQKMLASHLSKELRVKYQRRAFQLRKGDTVKVMNGEFRGKTGKVSSVDLDKRKVIIDGLQVTKKDGSKANVLFYPAKLMITELNLEDNKRIESLKKENKSAKVEKIVKSKEAKK